MINLLLFPVELSESYTYNLSTAELQLMIISLIDLYRWKIIHSISTVVKSHITTYLVLCEQQPETPKYS